MSICILCILRDNISLRRFPLTVCWPGCTLNSPGFQDFGAQHLKTEASRIALRGLDQSVQSFCPGIGHGIIEIGKDRLIPVVHSGQQWLERPFQTGRDTCFPVLVGGFGLLAVAFLPEVEKAFFQPVGGFQIRVERATRCLFSGFSVLTHPTVLSKSRQSLTECLSEHSSEGKQRLWKYFSRSSSQICSTGFNLGVLQNSPQRCTRLHSGISLCFSEGCAGVLPPLCSLPWFCDILPAVGYQRDFPQHDRKGSHAQNAATHTHLVRYTSAL